MTTDKSGLESSKIVKSPFVQFFKRGWENIVRLMAANVLFILFNIPSIVISYFFSSFFLLAFSRAFNLDSFIYISNETGNNVVSYEMFIFLLVFFINVLVSSCLVCVGPFQAGFANLYKNIRNGTSVSLFSDFKSGVKNNVGKSIITMVIGIVITFILLFAITFYSSINKVIMVLFIVLFFAFILIQNFVYQLIVSTDLSLFKIYKNAILFLFIRFIPCIGLALITFIFYIAIPFFLLMSASYLTLGIFVFLYSFLCLSWVQYFLNSYTRRLIERFVKESATENGAYSDDNDKINNVTSENTDS